jgi:hypothetical protein
MGHALDGKAVTMDKPDKVDVLLELAAKGSAGVRR